MPARARPRQRRCAPSACPIPGTAEPRERGAPRRPQDTGKYPRPGHNYCWSLPRSSNASTTGKKPRYYQEEALQLGITRVEVANVRHHTGRRFFDEARYRDAAEEFQWASDLQRVSAGMTSRNVPTSHGTLSLDGQPGPEPCTGRLPGERGPHCNYADNKDSVKLLVGVRFFPPQRTNKGAVVIQCVKGSIT